MPNPQLTEYITTRIARGGAKKVDFPLILWYIVCMKRSLPASFRPLLWSYQFDSLDPEKDKRAIIVNAINYGNLDHWKWLVSAYGKEGVRTMLESIPASEIRPQARRLASILFSVEYFSYAPRGARR